MHAHIVPQKLYFLIFAALLVMTGLTTGMAYIDLGVFNTVIALVIACIKATLVALFFMHLRWSTRVMRVVLLSALLWLGILITFTSVDYFTRDWTPVPKGWAESFLVRPPLPLENFSRLR